jgi:hypothetical protein
MGDWRTQHNEELHNLYSSPKISRMIKSKRMRQIGHVARTGETRKAYWIFVGMPERDYYENRDVCGWTILRWILER